MKAIYEVPYAIPELGAQRGDVIVVEPAHPEAPLVVVRGFDRNRLPMVLDHLDRLTLLSFHGPPSSSPRDLSQALAVRVRRERPSRLRVVS